MSETSGISQTMAYLNCQSGLTNTSVTQHCYTPVVHLRKVEGGDELRFMGANTRFGMCTATHPNMVSGQILAHVQ